MEQANGASEFAVDIHGSNTTDGASVSHKREASEMHGGGLADESSKWIHRDKLARIESEELQAAGIILPRGQSRARSKSQNRTRRDQSQDKVNGRAKTASGSIDQTTRSRKNSEVPTDPETPDAAAIPAWDLRLPEEIATDGNGYFSSNGSIKGVSKIPVAKLSPVPIPPEHLERGTPMIRRRDGSPAEEDSISYPKPRVRSGSTANSLGSATNFTLAQPAKRSVTESASPKKITPPTAGRKTSGPGKGANGSAGRPKTRGATSKDSSNSNTRPSTRSGERELSMGGNKAPEGDPPWMVSAYRPDPRLPPDQQLLPTVAKRLQQEKWEKEGKFGNIFDKEFRPLNEEGFGKPPPPALENPAYAKGGETGEAEKKTGEDWPLRPEPSSPAQQLGRSGSYSTMPKINDKHNPSPLPSPRVGTSQTQEPGIIRTPDVPEEAEEKKGGCGCCVVM